MAYLEPSNAIVHQMVRLLHITCTDYYYISSGKDVKTAVPVYFQILSWYSEITQNYTGNYSNISEH